MSIASKIQDLIKRMEIDPQGTRNELVSDENFNAKFRGRLMNIGGGKFFDPKSEQVFEISDDGKRITRVLPKSEIDEINRLPKS